MVAKNRLEVLAVIPARGGSKGIPRKNILDFAGYPLISYSIAAATQSKLVTRTIVSTDDEEIAQIAREYGAEIPFMRPAELAEDNTLDYPVFEHLLLELQQTEGYIPDVVVQLRPTSPVRPVNIVDDAVQLLIDHENATCVRGVVPAGQNPHKMWRIDPETRQMIPLLKVEGIKEPYNAPRQLLPDIYWQTGHIDAIRTSTITKQKSLTGDFLIPLMIDRQFTVDIDTPYDWKRYEYLVIESGLNMVIPGKKKRAFPNDIKLVVFDFDGVFSDNRVWVDGDGREMVAAYRSDSIGIKRLRKAGVNAMVLSSETDLAVEARCKKMDVPVIHGVEDKAPILKKYLADHDIDPEKVIYVGNDVNDLPCFPLVGFTVAVSDAQKDVIRQADYILDKPGGYGAVRELCERIISRVNS